MGAYRRYVLAPVVHGVCGLRALDPIRARVVSEARGFVVELGIGGGANLRHYAPDRVERLVGIDPFPDLLRRIVGNPAPAIPVSLHVAEAEALPLADGIADTVVVTFSLCSMGDPRAALLEARRVLRPGGRLLFAEHGLSDRFATARWQRRISPIWRRLAGGCRLDVDAPALVEAAGFDVAGGTIERGPLAGPDWLGHGFVGSVGRGGGV